MTDNHWHRISRFESHDFVGSWYRQTHGTAPSGAKISQINACFAQGREYFRNASLSDLSVRPLLLYYGVLSLSRGVILAKNPRKKEESLKPSHGLMVVDWQQTLAGGIQKVLDLQVQATKGTFRDLAEVCSNRHWVAFFRGPTNTTAGNHHDLGDVKFATDDSRLTLDNLITRLIQIGAEYPTLTNRPGRTTLARVVSHPPGMHFVFLAPIPVEFRALADGVDVFVGSSYQVFPGLQRGQDAQDTLVFRALNNNAHYAKFPVFHYQDQGTLMYVVFDFPNGDKLTEFLKLYLVSYILGMLVRYYPSKWIALLRNAPGDFAQPLLVRAVEAIGADFPAELSKQLPGHPRTLS